MSRRSVSFPRRVVMAPIRFYQRFVSPLSPPVCRFTPTCSNYAVEAIVRHGVLKGMALGAWRIVRCNPWGGMGFDPVPPRVMDFHTHNTDELCGVVNADAASFMPEGSKLYSVAVHPWDADNEEAFVKVAELASHPQVVAIGETGLDAKKGPPLDVQQRMFEKHISLAAAVGKPLVIHSVRTTEQVVRAKKQHADSSLPWAVHGFRGNENVVRTLLDNGLYLSFGPRFNEQALRMMPFDRLLIETDDDPELSIKDVASKVAATLGIGRRKLLRIVNENALAFLNL